ncbi:MAG TPA: glycoside hydrolase [Firmicutes bacterium]|nr:glycoside hydrolase [Bacillota bacterium]
MEKTKRAAEEGAGFPAKPIPLYYPGYDGAAAYRIPSLLVTREGTLLAFADRRGSGSQDYGNINIVVRRKAAGDGAFGGPVRLTDLPVSGTSAAFTIDTAAVQDRVTGRIFAFMDMFPESRGLMEPRLLAPGTGYQSVEGEKRLVLYAAGGGEFGTVREEDGIGRVCDREGRETGYTVTLGSDGLREMGNLYKDGTGRGNIYMLEDGPNRGELHVLRTSYLWMAYSDDDGKSWSAPVDITPQVKEDWMLFLGVGPGAGIQLADGTLAVPVYSANADVGGSQSSALIFSRDHGKTWRLGGSPQTCLGNDRRTMADPRRLLTEAQAVQLSGGEVRLFMRNTCAGCLYSAVSRDNGFSWSRVEEIPAVPEVYCQLSSLAYRKGGRDFVLLCSPALPGRRRGTLYLGEAQEDGRLVWTHRRVLCAGGFQYSCLALLENDGDTPRFGLLYEKNEDDAYSLVYTEFDESFLLGR